jgi:hypothetical protein
MTNGKMTGKVIVRRQVYFNERAFPARKMPPKNPMSKPLKPDDGSGLIRLTFVDDGESFRVTGTHVEDGINVVDYKDKKGNQHYSTIKEVKQWIEKTKIIQATNLIRPTRKSYVNNLASAMYGKIRTYDVNFHTKHNPSQQATERQAIVTERQAIVNRHSGFTQKTKREMES